MIAARHDTDIRICWRNLPEPRGDWELDGFGALITGNDLPTAVIVSLLTDRLAEASDALPVGSDDRRGWHGDTWLSSRHPGDRIGSRIWLLLNSVSTDKTPLLARNYAEEALAWLIEDGVAGRVDCDAFFINDRRDRLGITADIYRPDADPLRIRFDWAWNNFNPCLLQVEVSGGRPLFVLGTDDLDFVLTGDDGETVLVP